MSSACSGSASSIANFAGVRAPRAGHKSQKAVKFSPAPGAAGLCRVAPAAQRLKVRSLVGTAKGARNDVVSRQRVVRRAGMTAMPAEFFLCHNSLRDLAPSRAEALGYASAAVAADASFCAPDQSRADGTGTAKWHRRWQVSNKKDRLQSETGPSDQFQYITRM